MLQSKRIDNLYEKIFHAMFFLTFLYMAYPQVVDLLTIVKQGYLALYGILGVLLIIKICICKDRRLWISNYFQTLKPAKWIIICGCLYFAWDIFNYTYAMDKTYIASKYSFILKMSIMGIFTYIYVFSKETVYTYKRRANSILKNFAIISLCLAVLSSIFYYIGILTLQDKKIAPTADYNNYAITIIIGMICGICLLIQSSKGVVYKMIGIGIWFMVCIPCIYLSASRRAIYTTIILCIVGIIILGVTLILDKQNRKKVLTKSNFLILILLSIFVTTTITWQINQFEKYNERNDVAGLATTERIEEDIKHIDSFEETTLEKENAEPTGVRGAIWKYATQMVFSFDSKEWIIGGGGSYSNDIYAKVNDSRKINVINAFGGNKDKVMKLDPHNFILNDLLEGGLIKIIILFVLIILILVSIIKNIHMETLLSVTILLISIVVILGLLISAHFGIMWGRWSIMIIVLTVIMKGIRYWDNILK